jgi:hypothetical protein
VNGPGDVTFVGGPAAGRVEHVLYGDAVAMRTPGGEPCVYRVVRLAGQERVHSFGVPPEHANDGDWLIEQLAEAYRRSPL